MMGDYRLTVVMIEANPEFDAEKARTSYNYYSVSSTIEVRRLEVVLTEAQWEAVKQAVLGLWK